MGTFSSLLQCKCPRCRNDKMFYFSPFNLLNASKMKKDCEVCNLHFEVEPGFFWGAMYVSYAFNVAISVITAAVLMYFGIDSFWTIISTIVLIVFTTVNISIRYSRAILVYFFGGIEYKEI